MISENITILAIESSCDDTSAAIIRNGKILSNVTAVQLDHTKYGGVIPELASRQHQKLIVNVVNNAIERADVSKSEINAVAFTIGPGLAGSLLVGVSFAKAFAMSRGLPMIQVNHMEAHILAHFAEKPFPVFPFLCLTVSGGHTQIVRVDDFYSMTLLGQTLDDAAGEAFDKTGKILGLDYPAGPLIDKLAQLGTPRFSFPEPQMSNYDFSFSGLKTSILYFLQKQVAENPNFISENLNDICASVQEKIVTILLKKLRKAARDTGIKEIAIAGGVSANSGLRNGLKFMAEKEKWTIHILPMSLCTDNAGMIGIASHYKFLKKDFCASDIAPIVNLTMNDER